MPIALILALIPVVPHVVVSIEHVFKHSTGPAKKVAATSAIADILNVLAGVEGTTGADSPTMSAIEGMIEVFVKLYNDTGTFSHAGGGITLPNA